MNVVLFAWHSNEAKPYYCKWGSTGEVKECCTRSLPTFLLAMGNWIITYSCVYIKELKSRELREMISETYIMFTVFSGIEISSVTFVQGDLKVWKFGSPIYLLIGYGNVGEILMISTYVIFPHGRIRLTLPNRGWT